MVARAESFVALLRGINVGGRNKLPMKDLVRILERLGARNVRTYIQSGNAVFEVAARGSSALARKLSAEIEKEFGFDARAQVLSLDAIDEAMMRNPFPEAESAPASLHLGFLASLPKRPDLAKLDRLRQGSERFRLIGRVFYLHAPEGVGRSKLAAGAEQALGVPMTDRNWRTVCRVRELARD
ncbi:MAG TPA: DUF1697 domain-containing protein [Candidatus Polarisedimenticolaceae bacterium]|nr:DUF1697 domain-containing protein [Candidatus Polarisedimenticolaceae bacterium]